ncbi:hypothetical protein quinque_011261 [Culex quinquefasciatus]
MDPQEFLLAKNDFDLENFRIRLIECICELQSRRNEVTMLKSNLDESSRTNTSLQDDLKTFERENADLRDQLKITLDALNQKDSIKTGFLENAARQNVQLEAMTNEHERLNAKLQASQVKIMELSRDNNKLQDQLKVQKTARNQPAATEGADRIWKAMDTLNGHLQKLEEEHKVLKQTADSSTKIAEEAVLSVANSKAALEQVQAENGSMKKQILNLESKILSLKSNSEIEVTCGQNSYSKFEDQMKILTDELDCERETNNKLRNDIAALLLLQESLAKSGSTIEIGEADQTSQKPTMIDEGAGEEAKPMDVN